LLNQSSDQDLILLQWEKFLQLGLDPSEPEMIDPPPDINRFLKTFKRLGQACPSLPAMDTPVHALSGQAQFEFLQFTQATHAEFLKSLAHE